MRATIKLVDKLTVWLFKAVLVAIPAVVSSYCSFHVASREANAGYVLLVKALDTLSEAVERQGRVIEQMKGEVAVLKMLASARTGAGVTPFAEESAEFDAGTPLPSSLGAALKAQQPKRKLRIVP
jgi:hypothetical protein